VSCFGETVLIGQRAVRQCALRQSLISPFIGRRAVVTGLDILHVRLSEGLGTLLSLSMSWSPDGMCLALHKVGGTNGAQISASRNTEATRNAIRGSCCKKRDLAERASETRTYRLQSAQEGPRPRALLGRKDKNPFAADEGKQGGERMLELAAEFAGMVRRQIALLLAEWLPRA
jgi:hypothetical protein